MTFDLEQSQIRFNTAGYSCWRSGMKYSHNWQHKMLTDQDLWVIMEGHGQIELRDGPAELCSGRCIWMRPSHSYAVEQDPENPLKIHWFHFDTLDRQGQVQYPGLDSIPEYFHGGGSMNVMLMARTLFRVFKMQQASQGRAVAEHRNALLAQILKSLLMMALYEMRPGRPATSEVPEAEIAQNAAWYLDEVTDQITPVSQLAERFHVSRNRFTRIFREYWGITPQDYQINSRMNQAKHLLESTDLSISNIAMELGYADHYFFARQFKQKVGITPGKFREKRNDFNSKDISDNTGE